MADGRSTRRQLAKSAMSYVVVGAEIFKMTVIVVFLCIAALVAIYYPRDSDRPLSTAQMQELRQYYGAAYSEAGSKAQADEDPRYVEIAKRAAEAAGIRKRVEAFVTEHELEDKRILDIGAGRGHLQDLVKDYTALDISASARRYFHKPFVLGSATAMPFADGTFDAAWSIWVLEHVPNPEQALLEMRRVLKDQGLLFLLPAWHCTPFAAQGYPWRPFNDLGIRGKIVKASIPFRIFLSYYAIFPVRLTRHLQWMFQRQPTRLRYGKMEPNYDYYWGPDSDAVNSLDQHEVFLWFASRGDLCVDCTGSNHRLNIFPDQLVIRVNKEPGGQNRP